MGLAPLASISLESAAFVGGKVHNLVRADRDVVGETDFIQFPRSAVWKDLDANEILSSFSDCVDQLARCGLNRFPLIVRSSASAEDIGNSRMSGLLNSIAVWSVSELVDALIQLRNEAEELDSLPVSALVQERISYRFGVVAGICGNRVGPVAARLEFGESIVPVESEPSCWIAYEYSDGETSNWYVSEDAGVLAQEIDLAGYSERILAYVSSLQWPEKDCPWWYCEVEAGITDGGLFVFQIRFDLSGLVDVRGNVPQPLPFGTGRNFPVPVSHLTAGILTPVLSEQFGAAVALDESRSRLMCKANSVPPVKFIDSCIRQARKFGFTTLDSILHDAPVLNQRWRELRDFRRHNLEVEVEESGRFSILCQFIQTFFQWYFDNSTFRRAIGTEYLLESYDINGGVAELLSRESRSSRAARVYSGRSLEYALNLGDSYRDVYLFGDDSVGPPRLLEHLSGDRDLLFSMIEDYFSREEIFTSDMILLQTTVCEEAELDSAEQALYAALWYQEQDNQFKDAAYYVLRESLFKIEKLSAIPIEHLTQLYPSEILDLLGSKISAAEARLRGSLRVANRPVSEVTHHSTAQTEAIEVRSKSGLLESDKYFEGEVVIVDNLSVIAQYPESARLTTVFIAPSASPMACLQVPKTGGLWLYQLGELCHAAHILRSREEFDILIFGEVEQVAVARGLCRISRAGLGFRFEPN